MWDERYSEEGFAYGTQPNDFLVEVAEGRYHNGSSAVVQMLARKPT